MKTKTYVLITIASTMLLFLSSCKDKENPTETGIVENQIIYIASTPAGAEIWLDEANSGKLTPDTLRTTVASHKFTLKLTGYRDTTFSTSGKKDTLKVSFGPIAQGFFISSNPAGAQILIDGTNTNALTPCLVISTAGLHHIALMLQGYKSLDTLRTVTSNKIDSLSANLAPLPQGLYIITEPQGANITVDNAGSPLTAPCMIDLSAGTHNIKAQYANYHTTDTARTVKIHQADTVVLKLKPIAGIHAISYPVGAGIWVDGVNTGKITPATIDTLALGQHSVALKLKFYNDKVFSINSTLGKIDTTTSYLSGDTYETYGPVRLWVTSDGTTSHPAGICLRKGTAYSLKAANAVYIDLVLKDGLIAPDTTQIWSPIYYTFLTNNTYFLGTNESSLTVGNDVQPFGSGNWTGKLSLSTYKSFVVYDNDNNYSKVIVSKTGIDATTNKQWFEFIWIYNKVSGSYTF